MAKIPTQGTEIFFSDDGTTIEEIPCALTADVGASTADQIDVTCLQDKSRSYVRGLSSIGQITFTGAVDNETDTIETLDALQDAGTAVPWFIAFSDGTAPPTITGGVLTPPANRSGLSFKGYVASLSPQLEQNNVVKFQLVIQPESKPTWIIAPGAPAEVLAAVEATKGQTSVQHVGPTN